VQVWQTRVRNADPASHGTGADVTEDLLKTSSDLIPVMVNAGDSVTVDAAGTITSPNACVKIYWVNAGTSTLLGTIALDAGGESRMWVVRMVIMRKTTSVANIIVGLGLSTSAQNSVNYISQAVDFTSVAGQQIKITGTNGSSVANLVTLELFRILVN